MSNPALPSKVLILAAAALLASSPVSFADYYQPVGSPVKVSNVTTTAGWTHTEGPVFDGNGGILFGELNSNHTSGILWRHEIDGAVPNATSVVPNSGGMQGGHLLNGTHIVTADRDTRQISVRPLSNLTTITSSVSTIAGEPQFQFNGPNDIAIDSMGGIYFTDPNYEGFANGPGVDAVYYIAPGATSATRVLSLGLNGRPNGIALSPDQKSLYIGVWQTGAILKFSLNTPGVLTNPSAMGNYPSPDGIMVDPWGNLIITRSGGITCLSPSRASLFEINTGTSVTNVEIATGASGTYLYYTQGFGGNAIGLYRVALTQVPEPASLGVIGIPAALLLFRRRR